MAGIIPSLNRTDMATSRRARRKILTNDSNFSPEKAWQELAKNIKEILNHNTANLSFEENYRLAYRLVLYKNGDLLYNGVKGLVIENLEYLANNVVIPAFPSTTDDPVRQRTEEELLLKALREVWDYHATNMRLLGELLKYMDRVYTPSANLSPVRVLGSELFVDQIINKPSIKAQVVIAISNQLQRERDGHVINRSVVEECVDVFLSLEASRGLIANERGLGPVPLETDEGSNSFQEEHSTNSYDRAEILRLLHRSIFTSVVPGLEEAEDDSGSLSYPPSEYSLAPSRTDTTDYGVYARRMALSQATSRRSSFDDR